MHIGDKINSEQRTKNEPDEWLVGELTKLESTTSALGDFYFLIWKTGENKCK